MRLVRPEYPSPTNMILRGFEGINLGFGLLMLIDLFRIRKSSLLWVKFSFGASGSMLGRGLAKLVCVRLLNWMPATSLGGTETFSFLENPNEKEFKNCAVRDILYQTSK